MYPRRDLTHAEDAALHHEIQFRPFVYKINRAFLAPFLNVPLSAKLLRMDCL